MKKINYKKETTMQEQNEIQKQAAKKWYDYCRICQAKREIKKM